MYLHLVLKYVEFKNILRKIKVSLKLFYKDNTQICEYQHIILFETCVLVIKIFFVLYDSRLLTHFCAFLHHILLRLST